MSERERTQDGPAPEETSAAEKPNPGGDPADFLRLVKAAAELSAADADKEKLVGELIDVLVAMRAPGNERAEAKAVLGQLDLKSLTGMVDGQGRSARAEAVETVMGLGFPYALALAPEDFSYARSHEGEADVLALRQPRRDRARNVAAALGGVSAVAQAAVLVKMGFSPVDPVVLTAATATATAGWALWLRGRLGNRAADYAPGLLGIVLGLATVFTSIHPQVSQLIPALALLPIIGGVVAIGASAGHPKNPR